MQLHEINALLTLDTDNLPILFSTAKRDVHR